MASAATCCSLWERQQLSIINCTIALFVKHRLGALVQLGTCPEPSTAQHSMHSTAQTSSSMHLQTELNNPNACGAVQQN